MIILIAESKTMSACDTIQTPEALSLHSPVGNAVADKVMADVAAMSVSELADIAKFSPAMAARELQFAYEFPNKNLGMKAIEAYTGVVFRALGYNSFTEIEKSRLNDSVRIIASLYGYLRPDDIIKQYRFDFSTRLAPDRKPFYSFLRKDVTIALAKELKERGYCDILNLLPADASKCIDWKLIKRFGRVWKVDFKELREGGSCVTPAAGKLKTCRGELLKAIIAGNITAAESLTTLSTDNFLALGTPDYPDHIAFCV